MEDNFFRVVAIDPALDKLGIAVLDVNLITKQIHIRYAETMMQWLARKSIRKLSLNLDSGRLSCVTTKLT